MTYDPDAVVLGLKCGGEDLKTCFTIVFYVGIALVVFLLVKNKIFKKIKFCDYRINKLLKRLFLEC